VPDLLRSPREAVAAFLARVPIAPPPIERVPLDDALGRAIAGTIVADDDYPNAPRSVMDGFAVIANATPGRFEILGDIPMGAGAHVAVTSSSAVRIPTGGVLPPRATAVVPIEEARVEGGFVLVECRVESGVNIAERAADMRRGEPVLAPRRRLRASDIGVLAALGVTDVPVYRRPIVAVLSSGDELVEPGAQPEPGQIRDSNRYAIAGSLRAMGALARHYPTLRDEAGEFEQRLTIALRECDAVAVTGGSSIGDRDRLPAAIAKIAEPGIVVHGLRVKPGKPTLLGAHGVKPILGLPGNPTSASFMLEAVAAPIVAALVGAPTAASVLLARLSGPACSRKGWTWYIPVRVEDDEGSSVAHPLPLRSFSVSLGARADGFIIMEEPDEEWPAGMPVTVHRFYGG